MSEQTARERCTRTETNFVGHCAQSNAQRRNLPYNWPLRFAQLLYKSLPPKRKAGQVQVHSEKDRWIRPLQKRMIRATTFATSGCRQLGTTDTEPDDADHIEASC